MQYSMAANSILGRVARLLPSSDAREGPLSRLSASGRSILGTLGQGQRSGAASLRRPLARALTTATAGLALAVPVTPAAGAVPDAARPAAVQPGRSPVSFDLRPGVTSPAAASAPTVIHNHNRIVIHQQPGEDANALARSHHPAHRTERPAETQGRVSRRVLTASEPCPHVT